MVAKKVLIPAVGAVMLAGGAAAYYQFNWSQAALDPSEMAKVIPDDAIAAMFVSTDAQTWSKLEQFGTPEAKSVVKQNLETVQKQVLSAANLQYEKDLQPWIGNVMVAVLPAVQGGNSSTPSPLIVVGIRSKKDALDFANKLKNESKLKSTEADYKGIKIASYPVENTTAHTAVLKDFLVISPDQRTVEQAIDTLKGEPAFATNANFQTFLAQEVEVQNPIARFYVPDYAAAVQALIINRPVSGELPPAVMDQLKQVQSIAIGMGIDQEGVRLKGQTKFNEQFAKVEYKPTSGTVVAQFPTDTFALLSAAGMNRYWQQGVEQANSIPEAQMVLGMVRQNTQMMGIDLDRDVFGWMDGEFAIGLIPSTEGVLAQTGFGGVLVIDTSDRKTAEGLFSKLDGMAKLGSFKIQKRDVQGKSITEWQTPQGALLGHGWLDQDSAFVALGGPLADTIVTPNNSTLNNSDTFKAATGSLPKQNLGYFYLDMEKTMSLMQRTILVSNQSALPPETAALLNSIRGVGVTSSQPNKSTNQFEMLLSLKRAQ